MDILLGASYSKQMNLFTVTDGGFDFATVSFMSMNLGIQYKFKERQNYWK